MAEAGSIVPRAKPPDLPGLRLDSVIGKGGMSVVWSGEDIEHRRPVAVKVLQRGFAYDKSDLKQFFKEARTATMIRHPGIVKGYGLNCHEGLYYIVMELIDGYNLGQLLARKGRISERETLIVAESVAVAMEYAWTRHRTVHCDIKPENIMVNSDGAVKLADLGLCHTFNAMSRFTGKYSDEIIGTPAYMSPEQVRGQRDLDCRADIYALGAAMYHLATGSTLFPMDDNNAILCAHVDPSKAALDPCSLVPGLSHGFALLLEVMLVKDRDARLRDWDVALQLIRGLIDGGKAAFLRRNSPSSVRVDKQ